MNRSVRSRKRTTPARMSASCPPFMARSLSSGEGAKRAKVFRSVRRGDQGDALVTQEGLHRLADLVQALLRAGLVAQNQDRLRVGYSQEAPAVAEEDAHTVHVDQLVIL